MTPASKTKATKVGWNAIVMLIVAVVGMYISNSDRLFGKGVESGTLASQMDHNTTEIKRIDSQGCGPSMDVRTRLSGIEQIINKNEAGVQRNATAVNDGYNKLEGKIDKLSEKLDKILIRGAP